MACDGMRFVAPQFQPWCSFGEPSVERGIASGYNTVRLRAENNDPEVLETKHQEARMLV